MTFLLYCRVPHKLHRLALDVCCSGLILALLFMPAGAQTQDPQPKETVSGGYAIHQSIDVGVRVADTSGSASMYDTLVNLQTGPRILSQTVDMRAVANSYHPFFDDLMESSGGYGGDPSNVTSLRLSKGKMYNFQGLSAATVSISTTICSATRSFRLALFQTATHFRK